MPDASGSDAHESRSLFASADRCSARFEAAIGRDLSRLWSRSAGVFFCALAFAVICFGIELFNIAVSIDEEIRAVARGPNVAWILQDRWGMYFLNATLFPNADLPYISMLIGLSASALSAAFLVLLWSRERSWRHLVVACFASGTPVLAFLHHFYTSQYGFFIGVSVGAASLLLYVSGGKWRITLAAVGLVFAISVYQAIAMVVLCGYALHMISLRVLDRRDQSDSRTIWFDIAKFTMWFAACVVLHKVSSSGFRILASLGAGYSVVDGFYGRSFLSDYNATAVITRIRHALLGGSWYLGWQSGALVVVCTLSVAARFVTLDRPIGVRLAGVVMLLTAVVAPFMLVLLSGHDWPTRTLLGLPVLLAGLVHLGLGARAATVRLLVAALSLITLAHFAVSGSRLMYADHVRWWSDRDLAVRLQDRLAEAGVSRQTPVRMAVVGVPRFPPTAIRMSEETIGSSIFEWDQGNPWRIAMLLRLLGNDSVQGTGTPEDTRRALELAETMPAWPSPGSVRVVDGLAVVKFGDPTAPQIQRAQ